MKQLILVVSVWAAVSLAAPAAKAGDVCTYTVASTIGFPSVAAAMSWLDDVLEPARKRSGR